ncbi:MAG TPA: NCS2 family permease [archaeon]|nr:NCS2 family permease [archaeon]
MVDRFFGLKELNSKVSTELIAGLTTFMTMSYIIFVQPAVLSDAGMDFGSVMMATCISAAAASLIMGLWANYPVALAPGMGENFFFTYTVVIGMGVSWQNALGMVILSGIFFILLSYFRLRELVLDAVPHDLRYAIAGGIGAFILVIGLGHAGFLLRHQEIWEEIFSGPRIWEALRSLEWGFPPKLLRIYELSPFWGAVQGVAVSGFVLSVGLLLLRVRGALLLGMFGASAVALAAGLVHWKGLISAPPSIEPTLWKFDLSGLFTWRLFPLVLVFLFMVLFDTIGTLIGVSEAAGLVDKEGRLPRARRALLSDAFGTTIGAALGTSTVTCYIESAAGVQAGGRSGLTAVVCALLFLAAVFFSPLVQMVGSGVEAAGGVTLYPITSAALIVVGALMLNTLRKLSWKRWEKVVPALLLVLGMPLSYSIADGLAFGFISWPLLHLATGRAREVSWLLYLLGLIFLLRYIFL